MKKRIELLRGLPSGRLQNVISHLDRKRAASLRALAFYLLEFDQRREYEGLGFASTAEFGEAVLGRSQKEIRDLLRLARSLEKPSEIEGGHRQGTV